MLERFRSANEQLLIVYLVANDRMRTDHHTLAALDTNISIPNRDFECNVALLPLSRAGGEGAVDGEGRNRDVISVRVDDATKDILDEPRRFIRDREPARHLRGDLRRNFDLVQVGNRRIHRFEILFHHGFAALAIRFLDGMLDLGNCRLTRQDAADGEKRRLHNGVHAPAHAGLLSHIVPVDDVELELFVDDVALYFLRQVIPDLFRSIQAVKQEDAALFGVLEHVYAFKERVLMAGDKIRLIGFNKIWCADGFGTKTQMRHGHCAGFLRVVIEVALCEILCLFTDDLDRVLVRAHSSVRTETEEHATYHAFRFDGEGRVYGEGGVGDIVVDAYSEVILGLRLGEFIEDRLRHRGSEFFGRQTITPADHIDI